MNNIWLTAQAGTAQPNVITGEPINAPSHQTQTNTVQPSDANSASRTPAHKSNPMIQFVFIGLIFVMLYMVMFRGPKKKRQQQKQMISSLKKNDRVQTIGGILATVIDVGENEVTIKIDESNNTKVKLHPSAISRVIKEN